MGFRGIQGLTTQIKQSYAKIILPYERFCEQKRNAPATPSKPSSSNFNGAASPLTPSSPLSEPSDSEDDNPHPSGRTRRTRRADALREFALHHLVVPAESGYRESQKAARHHLSFAYRTPSCTAQQSQDEVNNGGESECPLLFSFLTSM